MKIIKFNEFILEEIKNENPESYINTLLNGLKKKIEKMFEFQREQTQEEEIESTIDVKTAKENSNNKEFATFKEYNVKLESSELSRYPATSLTVKFSDDDNAYSLLIEVDIKEALPKEDEEFQVNDIEKVYIKFKKYDVDTFEIIGQVSKNVDPQKIDEEFLVELKIEIDSEFGNEDEFEIET